MFPFGEPRINFITEKEDIMKRLYMLVFGYWSWYYLPWLGKKFYFVWSLFHWMLQLGVPFCYGVIALQKFHLCSFRREDEWRGYHERCRAAEAPHPEAQWEDHVVSVEEIESCAPTPLVFSYQMAPEISEILKPIRVFEDSAISIRAFTDNSIWGYCIFIHVSRL